MPISAIIVHYRTEDHLASCLDDLASRPDRPNEIVVVDNASLGNSDEWQKRYPNVAWVSLTANRGFAAAVNVGARRATTDFLLFLNPDARPDAGALKTLMAFMSEREDAAAVGPQLISPRGASQPPGGSFPTLASLVAEKIRRLDLGTRRSFRPTAPIEMDWVSGAVMLCRRRAFDAVGGMDEEFFLYYEDCDLGLRLRKEGWRSYLVPSARAVHHGGASFRAAGPRQLQAFRTSEDRYFRKHRPRWEALLLGVLRPIYERLDLRRALYQSPFEIPH